MIPISSVNINWVPGITLEEMEKHCILQAFRFYRGNKTQTSQALGIAIRTLDNKLEKYEADNERATKQSVDDKLKRDAILTRMRGIPQPPPGLTPATQATNERRADTIAGLEAGTGVHVEPAQKTSAQQVMSVPEREKVQTVLPRQATSSSHRKGR